jgi:hypothetical protein
MTFPEALAVILYDGKTAITRDGWNGRSLGKTMFVKTQVPDEHSQNTEKYCYMFVEPTGSGRGYTRVPWVPSQQDMFAQDWVKVE